MKNGALFDGETFLGAGGTAPLVALGSVLLAFASFVFLTQTPAEKTIHGGKPAQTATDTRVPSDAKKDTSPAVITITRKNALIASSALSVSQIQNLGTSPPPKTVAELSVIFDAYDQHIAKLLQQRWKLSPVTLATARIELAIAPDGQVRRAKILSAPDRSLQSLIEQLDAIGKPLPAVLEDGDYEIEVELK